MCYGRAGTAWALYDAALLLDNDRLGERALDLARRLPTTWPSPDVTHGLSGAGLAHLHLWRASGASDLLERVTGYADAVIDAARRDGDDWLWPTPAEVDSTLAGHNSYGFAHGVAGVGGFLLAASQAVHSGQRFGDVALAAGDTLARAARVDNGVVAWPTRVGGEPGADTGHWCGGPAGIGGFLIRLWAASGQARFLELAQASADACLREVWSSTVGACCGLSGVGHFLLDLAEFTGQERHGSRPTGSRASSMPGITSATGVA